MKVVIIGGVAGGATTATRLRRLNEKAEIIILERGYHISFANCGLPYYIGDVIKQKEELLLQTPQSFKERFNIEVRIRQEAIQINRDNKTVQVKNLETGEVYEESYDKLVLSPGAEPTNPFKEIIDSRIKTLRTVEDAIAIKQYIEENKPQNVTIIGGGYIGVEMTENLSQYSDMKVNIIEQSSHVIAPLDEDMAKFIHRKLSKNHIQLLLNTTVKSIQSKEKIELELDRQLYNNHDIDANSIKNTHNMNSNNIQSNIDYMNKSLETDFVILCIGVRPETKLATSCGLKVNVKGSIIVNKYMQTEDEDIYALGDAVQVTNFVTKKPAYIPLAGPANKQARVVANHICKLPARYEGTVGSSILKIFDNALGMTGINEATCIANELEYKTMIISPYSHATYYPNATQMTIKAIYEPETGKILGAQVWGKEGVDKITDILATAIRMNMTAHDLSELELCYAPPFSSAKSPINLLGNAIENEIDGLVETITWEEVEKQEQPYILDVRTKAEYAHSHLENAVFIPLDELRQRLNELDKTKTILVHCHTGLRSYIACRILSQNGFRCKNIMGGYYFYFV